MKLINPPPMRLLLFSQMKTVDAKRLSECKSTKIHKKSAIAEIISAMADFICSCKFLKRVYFYKI